MKKCLLYPNIFGVSAVQNGKKISCILKNNGKINLFSKKTIKFNKIFNIFFVRGFMYLFVSCYYLLAGLFEFEKNYITNEVKLGRKVRDSLNISLKNVSLFIIVICGIGAGCLFFGVLPIKLSYYLSPKNYNVFLKRFIIAIIKCLILYAMFLLFKLLSSFRQYCKFNSAIKEHEEKSGDVNLLTYLICSIFFAVFVLSFLGITLKFWFAIFVNVFVGVSVMAINYELFRKIQHTKYLNWLIFPFYFLIKEKCSQNEQKCVNIVLRELEQGGLQVLEEISEEKIAFSESYVCAKEILEKAGKFEKSDLDFIYCEILSKNRAEVKLVKTITSTEHKKVLKVVKRRAKGEPISKIFGRTNFYGLWFKVTKDVLSPRMDTEVLVEQVLKDCNKKTRVLDIGTGSGAIAVTIAKESGAKVVAVDISDKALLVAKENAKTNNVNVTFKKSDLFSGLSKFSKFDIVVSNPPYIPTADIDYLDEEVKNFDPLIALDGGESGLDFYERIIVGVVPYLAKNGKIFFEIGYSQAKDLKKLLQKNFKDIRIVKDFNKKDRVVVATMK